MQKEQRSKYLLKNTVIFALGNFGTKLIAFFLVPLYTNILATNEYGVVDLIYTIGMVLVPVLTLNIAESVMRFSLDKNAEQEKIMSTGILSFVLSMILCLLIFPISLGFSEIRDYAGYIYGYTVSLALSQISLSYLRGKEFLLKYSIGNIILSLSTAILNIVFLLFLHTGVRGYLMAYILSNLITAIYALIAGNILEVFKKFKIDIKLSKGMIKYSVVLIPNSFMWWIMNSLDRVMVTSMVGVAANGIYAVAYKVPTLVSMVASVFNQAWSYSAIREEDSSDKAEYSNSVYDKLVGINIVVGTGLLMIMKKFLQYYVGKEYYESWKYTPFLVIGFVFLTIGTFVATEYTVHKDSTGFVASGIVGAASNVLLNWLLISRIGAMGAAIATCISYILVYIYRVIDTRKYVVLKVLKVKHLIGYLLLLGAGITMFWDNMMGHVLLVVEFLMALIIFAKPWIELAKRFCMRLNKNGK